MVMRLSGRARFVSSPRIIGNRVGQRAVLRQVARVFLFSLFRSVRFGVISVQLVGGFKVLRSWFCASRALNYCWHNQSSKRTSLSGRRLTPTLYL